MDKCTSRHFFLYGGLELIKAGFHMIADRRRSQTLLRSAICDLRSAIIWKPAFKAIKTHGRNKRKRESTLFNFTNLNSIRFILMRLGDDFFTEFL